MSRPWKGLMIAYYKVVEARTENIKRLIKHCRDRITQTAVKPFITEGPSRGREC
ncbi:MAG: hypothetical protein QMD05_01035 [Candidatus Brocadiaceae bacterium]|nr:hypothetical protein [Candidatus Brocadiaceae bacterium]